jgi:predicted Zn-dependent protease
MVTDPYSMCPGGTGKKIKFCCSDLLSDLGKIEKLFEAEQYQACNQHVERLLNRHPDRACLWAAKTIALRSSGRTDEAAAAATTFLEKHPDNPMALAEAAVAAAISEGSQGESMALLQRAMTAAGDKISGRLFAAMSAVARRCMVEGDYLAARALCLLQSAIRSDDEDPPRLLGELAKAPQVPLVVKSELRPARCPEDVAWKGRFDEAVSIGNRGRWSEASEHLEQLLQEAGDAPAVWRNLALYRAWSADTDGAVEALDKYATLDVPLEDAVESLAL